VDELLERRRRRSSGSESSHDSLFSLGWAAGLSVAAALGTALGEATFFHLTYHAAAVGAADQFDAHHRLAAGADRACGRARCDAPRRLAQRPAERAAPLAPGLSRNGYGALRRAARASSRKVVALSGNH